MGKFIENFKRFKIDESENLSFSYRENDLPTEEMVNWFDYDFNSEPEDMDDLEYDIWISNLEKSFFEEFKNDLMELSYSQMLDVFQKAFNKRF